MQIYSSKLVNNAIFVHFLAILETSRPGGMFWRFSGRSGIRGSADLEQCSQKKVQIASVWKFAILASKIQKIQKKVDSVIWFDAKYAAKWNPKNLEFAKKPILSMKSWLKFVFVAFMSHTLTIFLELSRAALNFENFLSKSSEFLNWRYVTRIFGSSPWRSVNRLVLI